MKRVGVDVPDVPYPGGRTTAEFFRKAAEALRYERLTGKDIRNVSGSNVRHTIAALLTRVASAMDEAVDLQKAPDGRWVVYDLTYEERRQLPGDYHQPVWDGLGVPHFWVCSVCWDDGLQNGWPCEQARREGEKAARSGGLQAHL